ncbi:MAG: hypothetical protein Q9174_004717 [Haloplaca sp. 1 TL-2023]
MPSARKLFHRLHDRLPSRDRRKSKEPLSEQCVHQSESTSALSGSSHQGTGQQVNVEPTSSRSDEPVEATKELSVQPKAPPVVGERPSLWAQAYEILRQENPVLIHEFGRSLGVDDTSNHLGHDSGIDTAAERALAEIHAVETQRAQSKVVERVDRFSQRAIKIIVASKDLIALATSANPYAALAWSGVSLLLPLLLNPSQESEAATAGLDYAVNLMAVYEWQEKTYLRMEDCTARLEGLVIRLYALILEYEATLLVHMRRYAFKKWARDVFNSGEWSDRLAALQRQDANCKALTIAISENRTARWRDEERLWQQEFVKQPWQAEEQKNIRMLYSNYEQGKNLNPERLSDTCQWFLTHPDFLAWRKAQKSELLWLSADPGCGKSVLAKYLVDRKGEVLTVNEQLPTVAYFFFKDGDIDRTDAAKALCALLHQLILQQPHLYQYAKESFRIKNEQFLSDIDAMWRILIRVAASSSCEIICVLDALDECAERSRQRLIHSLVTFYQECSSDDNRSSSEIQRIKFLVTSRPDFQTVRHFTAWEQDFSEIRLYGEQESEQISREIDIVIRYKTKELSRTMGLGESQRSALEKNLTSIKHRTYLWLHLVFSDITKRLELHNKDIAKIIRTIPGDVDQVYTAMLNKSPDARRARKLLHIILAAYRPLTLQEINIAMVVEECHTSFEDLDCWDLKTAADRIKNICGLFATVVDSRVYLIHQTARDFLIGDQKNDWKMSFPLMDCDLILLKACIWYLLCSDLEADDCDIAKNWRTYKEQRADWSHIIDRVVNYLDITTGQTSTANIQKWSDATEKSPTQHVYLGYAAYHWSDHFVECDSIVPEMLLDVIIDRICDPNSRAFRLWWDVYCTGKHQQWHPATGETKLNVASALGLDAVASRLLDQNAVDIEEANDRGQTPLIYAVIGGKPGMVRNLLERGAQADHQDRTGKSALSYAVREGHETIVDSLLCNGCAVDLVDNAGFTPLVFAARKGLTGVAERLISLGAQLESRTIGDVGNDGFTPLLWAASNGHAAVVEQLLDHRAQLEARSSDDGVTPLLQAVWKGHIPVVDLLLAHGAQIEARRNKDGCTPLFLAAIRWNTALVERILAHQAQIEGRDNRGFTPLFWAVWEGCTAVIEFLLTQGANIEARDPQYFSTPLFWAVERDDPAVGQLLLAHGAQIEARDRYGSTPLFWAVRLGSHASIEVLLAHGAQLEAKNQFGSTPLFYAFEDSHIAVVELLLSHQAQTEARNQYGSTPLHWAADEGNTVVVKLLLDRGAQVEVSNNDGYTPLFFAARQGRTDVVELLLDHGAQAEARDTCGSTPLFCASLNGHTTTVKLLLESGGKAESEDHEGNTPVHAFVLNATAEDDEGVNDDESIEEDESIEDDQSTEDVENLAEDTSVREIANAEDDETVENRGTIEDQEMDEDMTVEYDESIEETRKADFDDDSIEYEILPIRRRAVELVELLLANGAKAGAKNRDGRTPLEIAKEKGLDGIVAVLEEYLARQSC